MNQNNLWKGIALIGVWGSLAVISLGKKDLGWIGAEVFIVSIVTLIIALKN